MIAFLLSGTMIYQSPMQRRLIVIGGRSPFSTKVGECHRGKQKRECWCEVCTTMEVEDRRNLWKLSQRLGVLENEQWYKVRLEEAREKGDTAWLQRHGGSLQRTLHVLCPEQTWLPWRFERVENCFWADMDNRRRFLEWLGREWLKRKVEEPSDWYHVTFRDVRGAPGGSGFLARYRGSLQRALAELLPEHHWLPWRFSSTARSWWVSPANRRRYLRWLASALHLRSPDDWYRVRVRDLHRFPGSRGLLSYYHGSLQAALVDLWPRSLTLHTPDSPMSLPPDLNMVPSESWQPWLFDQTSTSFWRRRENCCHYLQWLADRLHISRMTDWQKITDTQLYQWKGAWLLRHSGGLTALLHQLTTWSSSSSSSSSTERIPNFSLRSPEKTTSNGSKPQVALYNFVHRIFPDGIDIEMNCRHPRLLYARSKLPMELDIFVAAYDLVIEYHGEQHFTWNFKFGSPEALRARDEEKRQICERMGLTLLEIPYWWNQRENTFWEETHSHRPDIFEMFIKTRMLLSDELHPVSSFHHKQSISLSSSSIQFQQQHHHHHHHHQQRHQHYGVHTSLISCMDYDYIIEPPKWPSDRCIPMEFNIAS